MEFFQQGREAVAEEPQTGLCLRLIGQTVLDGMDRSPQEPHIWMSLFAQASRATTFF